MSAQPDAPSEACARCDRDFAVDFTPELEASLLDLLAEHSEINKHLDRAALARLCDPANYLGQSRVMVDRVLATLR